MKKLFFAAVVLILSLHLQAQFPGAAQGNNRSQAANLGHIYGKIVDSVGKPVNSASVILLQSKFDTITKKKKEILLKGTTTKGNGEFNFEELPMFGTLKLKISATGFKEHEQEVSFMPQKNGNGKPAQSGNQAPAMGSFDKDLGKIKLTESAGQLQGVTVTSTAAPMRLDIDKKVFSVDKNIVSAGGTAVDVMKNVPSVNVDIDGNVTIRNSSPQILVDGRPTTLTLEQIPADAIESVEVVTNPSAKYDASGGGAGILNIVLKKNRKTGYNGNVRLGVDKRGGINAGGDFSVRQGKLNLSASAMINQNRGRSTGTTERLSLLDTPNTFTNQSNFNKTSGAFMFGKLGIDYFVTNKTTLSLSGIKVHGEFEPNEVIDINTDSLFQTGNISTFSQRISTGKREFNGNGLIFGFKQLFPKQDEQLTADASFFSGKNENNSLYTTNYYTNGAGTISGTDLQRVIGDGSNKNINIQTDYVNPLSSKTKLEAGLRANLRNTVSNTYNYFFNDSIKDYVYLSNTAVNYKNNDNIYAAYVTVSSSIKDFGYKVGLRAESSSYEGELLSTGEKFSNKYPVSLFPSVFLSQKLQNKQELQLSYSRRINRPGFFQLIPFTDSTDRLNITRGNPALKPEFTQSFEFSYLKTFKGNNTILASLYYKHTDNLMTRFLDREIDPVSGEEVLINTYVNANSSYSTGAELTSQTYIRKWWDASINLNLYNSKIKTDSVQQTALWSWFGKLNNNFKLPANFTIQLTATYQSKTNLAVSQGGGFGPGGGGPFGQAQSASQGYIRPFWSTDIAIKKSFLKNNAASVTLSVNDIFRTRKQSQHSESAYFIQDYSRIRDPQMIRLNLSYRFGKMDMSLFKRKNTNTENASGATEGMQQ